MMNESRPVTSSTTAGSRDGRCRLAWWTLAIALFCGGLLRWTWIEDMEWKPDERWSYRMSQEVGRTGPWPRVGMPTSLGFANPGLSVWLFVAIGRMANTPTSMAHAVVLLNMIGLIGFAGAVRAYLPLKEREPWLWGLALQAVSPFAIRVSRKIWPPSILTPFLLLLWISHQYRLARWGAFTWGLVGAGIGQVHMSGWFVAAGLAAGTVIAECRRTLPRSRYWHWWLLGTVLGLISAVPWARTLPRSTLSPLAGTTELVAMRFAAHFYGLVSSSSSMLPFSTLGLGRDTREFQANPIIEAVPMHVPNLLRLFVFCAVVSRIAVWLLGAVVAPVIRSALQMSTDGAGRPKNGDAPALAEPAHAGGECATTAFYLWSMIMIPSIIYLMTVDVYFYHYYFVMCPFVFVLVAVCMLPWRRVLLALVVAQALMSVAFLSYIHRTGGTTQGEYGLSYARQGKR